jgi:effector-binding domain-containing protein
MEYDVRIETISAERPTAVVRRRAGLRELPRVVPEACGLVWNALRAAQVKGAGRHVSLYLDEQINLEVGVEMDGPFAGSGEVIASALPAGRVATAVHFGPYPQLHRAHEAIRDWCAKHGHALAGPNWEIYGHWDQAWDKDPSGIRTDVYYLLK